MLEFMVIKYTPQQDDDLGVHSTTIDSTSAHKKLQSVQAYSIQQCYSSTVAWGSLGVIGTGQTNVADSNVPTFSSHTMPAAYCKELQTILGPPEKFQRHNCATQRPSFRYSQVCSAIEG
jgi:hypothetical protein